MSSAENIYVKMQKLNNQTQVKLQQMADASSAKSFEYNSREASTSRDWQKMMSDTSHQREVADLKKAGLNPVLSSNQGAAAYSTQSASDHADNAVNAIGSLQSSMLNGMAGIAQTRISSSAALKAAQTQAAAMRAAAAAQASASKYAADMNFKTQEMRAKYDYKIALERPSTSIAGIADKIMSNLGLYGTTRKVFGSAIKDAANSLIKNPSRFFDNQNNVTKKNFTLSKQGRIEVGNTLDRLNLNNTSGMRRVYVRAMVFNDKASQVALRTAIAASNTQMILARRRVLNNSRW